MKTSGIKNIIFDFGGVLLNIDYSKTSTAFRQLGFDNFDEMYGQFTADSLFEQLETGAVSNEAFLDRLLSAAKKDIDRSQLAAAWNAMLLDYRLESLSFLEKLSGHYKLYLLSNTNAIHIDEFRQRFVRETDQPSLDAYFTKAYYSHEVGLRKPNADIYEFVLKDAGLKPGETLFIDDSINNIEAAKKLGIHTHLLLPNERIEQLQLL